ncbi:MAG: hypothetical protein WCG01_03150 [bacterium]
MRDEYRQFFEQIKVANNILITFGKSADDSLPTALACAQFLKILNKTTAVAADPAFIDSRLSFLPDFNIITNKLSGLNNSELSLNISQTEIENITHYFKNDKLVIQLIGTDKILDRSQLNFTANKPKYDLIIVVGTTDLESLGDIFLKNSDFFYQTPIINIDFSPTNEYFGQINIIDLNSVSSGEVLYNIISNHDEDIITNEIATNLLASIIISTNSFKVKNISPKTLSTTARLIELGGDREQIVNQLYRSRNMNVLKLWGVVLARLKSLNNNQLIWTEITHEDFIKTKTTHKDLKHLIEELIVNIPSAKVIVLFYEVAIDLVRTTEAIVHGVKNLNVDQLLSDFNPIGVKSNILIRSKESIMEFEKHVINVIEKKLTDFN